MSDDCKRELNQTHNPTLQLRFVKQACSKGIQPSLVLQEIQPTGQLSLKIGASFAPSCIVKLQSLQVIVLVALEGTVCPECGFSAGKRQPHPLRRPSLISNHMVVSMFRFIPSSLIINQQANEVKEIGL